MKVETAAMNELLSMFREGVALDLMTLAQLHDRELDEKTVCLLQQDCFPELLRFRLESTEGTEAIGIMAAVIQQLHMDSAQSDDLAADFAAIYLTHGIGASPCESVWIDEESLAMQQPMFEVREAYAEYGYKVPDWRQRTDDHLVFQLQFVAQLLERHDSQSLRDAAHFLDRHLLRWMPDFANRVAQRAATPFYAILAMLTLHYLDETRDVLALLLDTPRPTAEAVEQLCKAPTEEVALPMPSRYVPGSTPSW
jgi:TorA maturation chaperone TorD